MQLATTSNDFTRFGSGASGSVIAKRLAEDPKNSILLVECGPSSYSDTTIETPFLSDRFQNTYRDWKFETTTQSNLRPNRVVDWPQGKVGGGSTAINYLRYSRGSKHDYDSWAAKGAMGWNYDNIVKFFKNVEKAVGNQSRTLGTTGEIPLSQDMYNKFIKFIMDAAKAIGYPEVNYNDGGLAEGFSIPERTVKDGIRQYAGNVYLWPSIMNKTTNLHAKFNTLVRRVLFDRSFIRKAVGVEIELPDGNRRSIGARKEVILSAGAIKSPQLLMLSGIGPREQLGRFGISIIKELPGVGSNLQDHVTVPIYFNVAKHMAFDSFSSNKLYGSFPEYIFRGTGPMGMPSGPTVIGHLKSRYFGTGRAASTFGHPFPDIQYIIQQRTRSKDDVSDPDEPLLKNSGISDNKVPYNMVVKVNLLHPKSTGELRLQSRNPQQHPKIDPRYLTNEDDVKILIDGMQTIEEFESSILFRLHDITMKFTDTCGGAREKKSFRPESFYDCYIKQMATTGNDVCCTNKMGYRRDRMSVVDHNLRVHGVENLRVADASVMPHLTSSGLQAACYMIGEKAADLIKKKWNM